MIESYISDELLIEGIFGACSWFIYWKWLRDAIELHDFLEGVIAWTLLWYTRKFGVTLYNSIKRQNGWKDWKLYLIKPKKSED
jgi:hypothetical protein